MPLSVAKKREQRQAAPDRGLCSCCGHRVPRGAGKLCDGCLDSKRRSRERLAGNAFCAECLSWHRGDCISPRPAPGPVSTQGDSR